MLGRALSLATVALLVGCLTAVAVRAAENLEAGKSPSQIFAGTCNACHKSPRGLLKTVPASSLPGFLRQHYTTSSDMASVLASFLVSNGAADTRYQSKDSPKSDQARQKDAKPDQLDRFGRRQNPAAQEASRPDTDGLTPQGEGGGRPGRDARRLARPGQTPDVVRPTDGQTPVQATTDSKSGSRQKLGKRAKPGAEPKAEEAAKEAAKGDAAKEDAAKIEAAKEAPKTESAKSDAAKAEGDKPEAAKPAAEAKPDTAKPDTAKLDADKSDSSKSETAKSETAKSEAATSETAKSDTRSDSNKSEAAKVDAPRESGGSAATPLRSDPVPPVTPAPPAAAMTTTGTPEPAASPSPAAAAPPPPPATVNASAPPSPRLTPAGPPAPPISR